jgi:hypothetical protein
MKRLFLLGLLLVLAGCAHMSKVGSGDALVKDRLHVTVDTAWNRFEHGYADDTPTWTIEGITVDSLQFYVGIKDGQAIAPTPSDQKGLTPLAFKAGMQPADIVGLYQSLYTRAGSSFTLDKLEPAEFIGMQGFRFEYSVIRKLDDVRLKGVAWGAVRNGELFVINYSAPRLAFFPKYAGQVEMLARSARVSG